MERGCVFHFRTAAMGEPAGWFSPSGGCHEVDAAEYHEQSAAAPHPFAGGSIILPVEPSLHPCAGYSRKGDDEAVSKREQSGQGKRQDGLRARQPECDPKDRGHEGEGAWAKRDSEG